MSYAIVRHEKYNKGKTGIAGTHHERKSKGHENKNIDPERTHLNFYFKKPELTYIKEFQRIKGENDLQGQIKTTSNITCEYMVTSDSKFFDKLGYEETKRYFEESYNYLCNYRGLEEKYIISAVVHMDEDSPHMHMVYVPVIHTVDKLGQPIEKLSCRDFWRGKNTYGKLQDTFYEHVTSKGFKLERGQAKELTGREHLSPEKYKQITNYYETKKLLENMTLELPKVPDIADISKFNIKRDDKILNEIIKPKDDVIKGLYADNVALNRKLSEQTKVIEKATEFEIEYDAIIANNQELQQECDNMASEFSKKVNQIEDKYNTKANNLEIKFSNETSQLKSNYESAVYNIEKEAKKRVRELERENTGLYRIISTLQHTIEKVFSWVADKFNVKDKDELKEDFENDTYTSLDVEKQIARLDREDDWDMEM